MRGMFKKRGGLDVSHRFYHKSEGGDSDGRYEIKWRRRKRNRRIVGLTLAVCAVLAVGAAYYVTNGSEILQAVRSGEPAADVESDGSAGGSAGVGEAAASSTPTVLLGEFFTDYAWDPDQGRQSNLRTASEAIDNTLLAPGEEFSALAVLSSLDYKPAKVFSDGGVAYEEGGGLCQVSSTLYMAANYAGLEITERNPHYAELPYIQPGLDATVWFGTNGWGALDMKFKNNTDGNILVREYVNEEGFLVAQIYGERPTGKTVSMDSQRVEEDVQKGLKWDTYKKVRDSDGNVLEDGLLYETTYSYNPPAPPELKHETNEPRGAGWVDADNTTGWANN